MIFRRKKGLRSHSQAKKAVEESNEQVGEALAKAPDIMGITNRLRAQRVNNSFDVRLLKAFGDSP